MSLLTPTLTRRVCAAGLVLALSLGAAGCDHATDPDGPRLIDRFGPFTQLEPLTASQPTVDFAAGETVDFTAAFNKQVAWVLEITGQESGAVKVIEGFSSTLTAENARWDGGTTTLPFFKDEPVEASLRVPAENADADVTTLEVLSPKVYPGIVVADFEGGDRITVTNPEFEFDLNGISDEVPPAQGDGFYLLRGTDDVVVNNFFIGLITIFPPGGAEFFEVPTDIASDLYLNFFLYGYGTPNTIPVVEVVVNEGGQDIIVPLGTDVEFPNVLPAEWDGWVAYSEPASSFGQFGRGLTDAQTQQIVAIRVVLISNAANQPTPPLQVEYGIDYLTFTSGGPLEL